MKNSLHFKGLLDSSLRSASPHIPLSPPMSTGSSASTSVQREGDSPAKARNTKRPGFEEYTSYNDRWKARYEQLKEFKKEHGHLRVPASVPGLGRWVTCQRQERRRKKISKDRIKALDAIGFLWCGFPTVRMPQESGGSGSETETVAVSFDGHDDIAGTAGGSAKARKPAVAKLRNCSYIQQQEDEYWYVQEKSHWKRDDSDQKEEEEGAIPSKLQLLHKLVMTQEKMQLQSEKIQQLQSEKIQQLQSEKIQQLQGKEAWHIKKMPRQSRSNRHRKDYLDEEGDDSDEDAYNETVAPNHKERKLRHLKEPHNKKRCRRDDSD
ncbi:Helicase associated domain [Seminavis robusta]|uniref:Helicase associated domain n=1 Tax=Seminavis robusta TaxID=568900 RepID=A0A9N8D8K9_9STRA|nr:Helicase associated domain [Seminavis robusta]|eukprot:Sro31_g020540.1 Helicase associated domain (322) ;mRNA; r:153931-154896